MGADGKQLEGLVAFVEQTLLPQGFEVKTNERIYNVAGVQIAEFDIEVRGKVGSTDIAWLIECRDRPGQGPAPASWIEQLVGRRTRFGFNKITAVSTTGFTAGATEFAQAQGIELREFKEISAWEFGDWLVIDHHLIRRELRRLDHVLILVNKRESDERKAALLDVIAGASGNAAYLKSSMTGALVSATVAFSDAVDKTGKLSEELLPNGPGKRIKLHVRYENDEDHFVVDTVLGTIRVEAIVFDGELSVRETLAPLAKTAEYRRTETGEAISQVAVFAPQEMHGMKISMEMHRMAKSGETYIIMRRLSDDKQ